LVTAARGGDRNALDQLLRRHYDRINAICRRIAGSTRDGDDACQEALIKITRSIGRFDGRASFTTWAYRIATNAALDELRKRARRPTLHHSEVDPLADQVDAVAQRRIESIVERSTIDEALATLPEEFRTAVVLRDVLDLDYAEIAALLEVPPGTVKSRIARGRTALADRLRLDDLPPLPPDEDPSSHPHRAPDPSGPDRSSRTASTTDVAAIEASGNQSTPAQRPIEQDD
jgi:RNA polymerase sigma-70 factor (ECF subfamily)